MTKSFEQIWSRIVTHSGDTFYTKTGLDFTYKIRGEGFYSGRTNYRISRSDFEKAYSMSPINLGQINSLVRGSSYVYAVLKDQRITSEGKRKEIEPTEANTKSFPCKCLYCEGSSIDHGIIDPMNQHPCPALGCVKGWHTLLGCRDDYEICGHCKGSGIEPGIPKNPLIRLKDPCYICKGTSLVKIQ